MNILLSMPIKSFKVQVIETEDKDYELVYFRNGEKLETYEYASENKDNAFRDYRTIVTVLTHVYNSNSKANIRGPF